MSWLCRPCPGGGLENGICLRGGVAPFKGARALAGQAPEPRAQRVVQNKLFDLIRHIPVIPRIEFHACVAKHFGHCRFPRTRDGDPYRHCLQEGIAEGLDHRRKNERAAFPVQLEEILGVDVPSEYDVLGKPQFIGQSMDAARVIRVDLATGDNELRSSYLMLGTIELLIARVTMLDATVSTGPVFDASNLHFSSNFGLDDGTLANGQATYAIESFIAGPDMQIRDASIGLILRNLDADALEAYGAAAQRSAATAGLANPDQLFVDIAPAVERLLAAQPSIVLDPVRFTLNDEIFDARIQFDTKASALPPAGALDLRDPTFWFALLDVAATANVSKNLARSLAVQAMTLQFAANQTVPPDQIHYMAEAQAGLILATLVGQGILTENGDNYSTELGFTDRGLSVNGNPLPFGQP